MLPKKNKHIAIIAHRKYARTKHTLDVLAQPANREDETDFLNQKEIKKC